jgi:hypothetical protein
MGTGRLYVPVSQYISELLPANLIELPDALADLWMEPPAIANDPFDLRMAFLVNEELALGIPGLDAVQLVIAADGNATALMFEATADGTPAIKLLDVPIALRFSPDLLKPVRQASSGGWEPDPSKKYVDVALSQITVSIDLDGNFTITGGVQIDLPASMIGDTGVVVEAKDIQLYLDATSAPPGKPTGWRGVHIAEAGLYLPGDLGAAVGSLQLSDAYIGNGGFSGAVTDTWSGGLNVSLFGADFTLTSASLQFVQNSLTQSEIKGTLTVPFFVEPAPVDIGINLDGTLAIRVDSPDGLFLLSKPGLLQFEVDSLGFKRSAGVASVSLSGKLTPELENLNWPSFDIKSLEIDSHGNVHLQGGWLDLPSGYALDLYGFTIEVTKVGFGKTDDGGKWVGFSGAVNLVTGLPAGASVEGLRVTWYDDPSKGGPRLTLNGVGVEFAVPDVVQFKGAVAYHELSGGEHRFDGSLALDLEAIDLDIDGQIVIGSRATYRYLALYLDAELPAGIPLWATGLGLYGVAGLFALNMEPHKCADQPWYAMPGANPTDWFHEVIAPNKQPGVTDLNKWAGRDGSLGFGAGVTLGTVADNGYTFAGKVLVVLVFPGPIVLVEGAANLLKERAKLADSDPAFHAIAVLDNRAGTITLGLDAKYKYANAGELIDIRGSADAFFSYADPALWHIYLGQKDPQTKRIRAHLFSLYEADGYLMAEDNKSLAVGALFGYNAGWKFGPVALELQAWIFGDALLSFKPAHLHGDLGVHGSVGLKVCGFGASLTVDADLSGDSARPFLVIGHFHVEAGLPWPLPKFSKDVTIEWPPNPQPPPLPVPLKEVAIEHLKVSTSWPLPNGSLPNGTQSDLLVPDYDTGDGFMDPPPPLPSPPDLTAPPPADAPVVPLDARPHVTFTRPVNDDALVGVNAQLPTPGWEQIGDPSRSDNPLSVRYGLAEVALDKWDPGASVWEAVATTTNPGDALKLYGSWAPTPPAPGATVSVPSQVKLWLWSKTPYDYVRHTSGSWGDWFGGAFPNYPCQPAVEEVTTCYDFGSLDPTSALSPPLIIPNSGVRLIWFGPVPAYPSVEAQPVDGLTVALCFRGQGMLLWLDPPADEVSFTVISSTPDDVIVTGYDLQGGRYGPVRGGTAPSPEIVLAGSNLREIQVEGSFCVFRICVTRPAPGSPSAGAVAEHDQHLIDALATWSAKGNVLDPWQTYRLKLVTTAQTQNPSGTGQALTQTQVAYFQTEGPPVLANLSLPLNAGPDAAAMTLLDSHGNTVGVDGSPSTQPVLKSDLNSLGAYVDQTVPATVPAPGARPQLPRPVYRAYDIGVRFNEDYVDLMYRLDRRDLGLYLFDANNRPVRDAQGRLVVLGNPWGTAEQLSLSESDLRWIASIDGSDCASLDVSVIPHNTTLSAASDQQVLLADFVYDARLIPLLLHDDFSSYAAGASANGPAGTLGAWTVQDDGTVGGPSSWTVQSTGTPASYNVAQTSPIGGPPDDPLDPRKPGTALLTGDPLWTDVRMSAYVRSAAGGALGMVFRYQGPAAYYRFSMDHNSGYRRLVRVIGGVPTILAQDSFAYTLNTDQLITVEAVGSSLNVYLDGELLFAVADLTLVAGKIGLYCRDDPTAEFSDVRVDDFRQGAPIAYQYRFTTSTATNFFHHMHSFDDRSWLATIDSDPGLDASVSAALSAAVAPDVAPSDPEQKAYEELATLTLGQAAAAYAAQVEATRVERDSKPIGWLVRSPEPLDWTRTDLEFSLAPDQTFIPTPPTELKLVDLAPGSGLPSDASTSVLVRQSTPLDGQLIEWLQMPGGLASPPRPALFIDSFDGSGGVLFDETFGPNALDAYTIVDQGTVLAPSYWRVTGGQIVQGSWIFGGAFQAAEDGKPGTMAVAGSEQWTDVRITASLQTALVGAAGIVFRYVDENNYYRVAIDPYFGYRRLVRCVSGVVKVLWEDSQSVSARQPHQLVLYAFGSTVFGYMDGEPLFSIQDATFAAGRVGLYSWLDVDAIFSELMVESLEHNPVLWSPAFDDLSEVAVTDDPAATGGPSAWAASGGELDQTSPITDTSESLGAPGTYAAGGDPSADDVRISLRLRSDAAGAIGIMFRVRDAADYYRLSFDVTAGRRRLVKVISGTPSVLWEDTTQGYAAGEWYELTIDAVADSLSATLNGAPLFSVSDGDIATGRVALYCSGCTAARFQSVLVCDLAVRAGNWRLRDESGASASPSNWTIQNGSLIQSAQVGSPGAPYAGTLALVDGQSWTNLRLTVRLHADDPHPIGAIIRYAGPGDYYRFSLDTSRSQRRLDAFVGGTPTTLWSDSGAFDVSTPFTLTFDAAGDRLSGYVNGQLAFRVADSSLAQGAAGVYCSQNPGLHVQYLEVEAPPPDAYAVLADNFAAGKWSEWTVVDQGTTGGPSSWSIGRDALHQTSNIHDTPVDGTTPPKLGTMASAGDPSWSDIALAVRIASPAGGTVGGCVRYADAQHYYRFSMDSSLAYRRLVKCVGGTFTTLWEDGVAYDASRAHDLVITAVGTLIRGYIDDVPLFSVNDADLGRGGVALYSWDNTDARFSDVRVTPTDALPAVWVIDDHFQVLMSGRWTFADESATGAPSNWQIAGGALMQTATVGGGAGEDEPAKPGTYATAGDAATSDCRVVARARSDGLGALGVVGRFKDTNNYYRLSWDASEGALHLVKKVSGAVASLWTAAKPFDTTRDFLLTLDLVGAQITAWLDGEWLCTVEDTDLGAGQGGLYTAAEPTARFAEFCLGIPAWSHLYRFADEPPPADGRRIVVWGGAPDSSLSAPRGVDYRFAAGPGERGLAPPDAVPVDLRLVTNDGTVTHTRRFLRDDSYAPLNADVLRKADGTGLFLAAAGGNALTPGTYRLQLTYRRDNTNRDPASLVLSQAGDTGDEQVVLDAPWRASASAVEA